MERRLTDRTRAKPAIRGIVSLAFTATLLMLVACGANATDGSHITLSGPQASTSTPTVCPSPTATGKLAYSSDGPYCGTGATSGPEKGHDTCDGPGQPTCSPLPPLPNTWAPVASTAPADVLAALQACPDYQSPLQEFQLPASDTYSFDTPVLVLNATTGTGAHVQGVDMPSFIISAFVNGARSVIYDVQYDPSAHRLRISSVGQQQPNDPHYGKPFPWDGVFAGSATQALASQRGMALRSGTTPQLVDFPLDPRAGPPQPTILWNGGGYNEAEPIWRLQGADSKLYFVGIDGHVYAASDLPLAPNATLVHP